MRDYLLLIVIATLCAVVLQLTDRPAVQPAQHAAHGAPESPPA